MAIVIIIVLAAVAIWADLKWGPDSYMMQESTKPTYKRRKY